MRDPGCPLDFVELFFDPVSVRGPRRIHGGILLSRLFAKQNTSGTGQISRYQFHDSFCEASCLASSREARFGSRGIDLLKGPSSLPPRIIPSFIIYTLVARRDEYVRRRATLGEESGVARCT